MTDNGRGRSGGRPYGRGGQGDARGDQQSRRPGAGPQQQAAPQLQGAWAGRASAQQQRNEPPPPAQRPAGGRGVSRRREERQESFVMTRPGYDFNKKGSTGNAVNLASNYFLITSRPDMHLLQYRVDFNPDIEHIGMRRALVGVHAATLGKYIFTGAELYNIVRLPQPLELVSTKRSDGSPVHITFRLVGELQKEDPHYVTIMNNILRNCLRMLNLQLIRRDYYDPEARQRIPQHNIEIWPGYDTSIRFHDGGLMLNVEIAHKYLRSETALDVIRAAYRREGGGPGFQDACRADLEGSVIMTHYNRKTYRIDEVAFEMNPMSTFHLRREDRDVTYVEYYRTRYNLEIRDMTQFLLVSRPSRRDINRGDDQPIFLVPELCGMTGLTAEHRNNFNLMRDLHAVTRLNPDRRVEALMNFRRRLQNTPAIQQELNNWGLQFSNSLVTCQGRQQGPQKILQNIEYDGINGDWSRNVQRNRYAVTAQIQYWLVVFPRQMERETRQFVALMRQVGQPQNFVLPEPHFVPTPSDRLNDYSDTIRNACGQHEYSMVMCVLRNNRADTYTTIKKLTFCDIGIPSQVVTGRILNSQRDPMTIATKVTMQVASKLGAEPWQVQMPSQSYMVVGYDTYHDARQRLAVGACVASTNMHFTRYYSSVTLHENNEEISPTMGNHITRALTAFYKKNNKLPNFIIVYRDGIGSGDVQNLRETEVASIERACAEVANTVKLPVPKIAFIVVSKRITTRFFLMNGAKASNPETGTVVDNTVTLRERYDFFLVPQSTRQGTVSPTSFNIIKDDMGIPPDRHQLLAYKLTHLYYNWAGTLRVPAPIQYAHRLAYLVGEKLRTEPHESLADTPYYL